MLRCPAWVVWGRALALLAVGLLALPACAPQVVEQPGAPVERVLDQPSHLYVTTQQRADARQPFLLLLPRQPVAVAILLPGGDGQIGLEESGEITRSHNFVVRIRGMLVREGIAAAVIAPPTDREAMVSFRTSQAHVLDLKGVIAYLRQTLNVPVWLVGTSRGTVSAAYVSSHLSGRDGPDGIVLTSSVFLDTKAGSVYSAELDAIRVPALLVHHQLDACKVCPSRLAGQLLDRLDHAPAKELVRIEGGGPPSGDPCAGLHYHGFIGKEQETTHLIAEWIRAHPPGR